MEGQSRKGNLFRTRPPSNQSSPLTRPPLRLSCALIDADRRGEGTGGESDERGPTSPRRLISWFCIRRTSMPAQATGCFSPCPVLAVQCTAQRGYMGSQAPELDGEAREMHMRRTYGTRAGTNEYSSGRFIASSLVFAPCAHPTGRGVTFGSINGHVGTDKRRHQKEETSPSTTYPSEHSHPAQALGFIERLMGSITPRGRPK
jgi:hypothetical protein